MRLAVTNADRARLRRRVLPRIVLAYLLAGISLALGGAAMGGTAVLAPAIGFLVGLPALFLVFVAATVRPEFGRSPRSVLAFAVAGGLLSAALFWIVLLGGVEPPTLVGLAALLGFGTAFGLACAAVYAALGRALPLR